MQPLLSRSDVSIEIKWQAKGFPFCIHGHSSSYKWQTNPHIYDQTKVAKEEALSHRRFLISFDQVMKGLFSVLVLSLVLITMQSSRPCGAQSLQQQFLDPHNRARSQVGVGGMRWDNKVAAYAQNYANERRGDCALRHSGGQYGENIFWGKGRVFTPEDAVRSWVNEKQFYDYASNTCAAGRVCGHYTQVVWRDSVRLGCARVVCNDGAYFITCNYDPPGNFNGRRPYVAASLHNASATELLSEA